jgi:FtsH-binding integral membrane protein
MSFKPLETAYQSTDAYRQQGIMTQVYAWMTAGLLVTGATAMYVANSFASLINGPVLIGFFIVEIILVIAISGAINKLSGTVATGLFLLYSLINGVTLSMIFLAYTPVSIATTFFITAGTFGAMSVYGYVTKQDLGKFSSILVMALIGFLIASVVNIFLQNEMLYWIITYAGILIFVGLTARDTQKIKEMAAQASTGNETIVRRIAILGALMLYLDFINLFLLLLRIFGNRN